MASEIRRLLALVVVSATVFFIQLGAAALWDVDEPRNATCAREMLEAGQWIVPTFNGQLRTDKPVMLYWLMMCAYQAFGVNEFAARFWSAAFAVGSVLVTYALGRRLFCPQAAWWAGFMLATCLNFSVVARAATPDSIFIFFVTLAFATFITGAAKRGMAAGQWNAPPLSSFVAMYVFMGAAVLSKGPVGVLLPMAVNCVWLCVMGRPVEPTASEVAPSWRGSIQSGLAYFLTTFTPRRVLKAIWQLRPVTALVVVSLVVLPWYAAVYLRTDGQWVRGFLLTHNVGRYLQSMQNHSGPIYYYLIALSAGFFPWSLFFTPSFKALHARVRSNDPWRPGLLFLLCWLLTYLIFFSFARTKLPSYVLPAYPALALISGCYLHALLSSPTARLRWPAIASATLVLVGVAIGVIGLIFFTRYLPSERSIAAATLAPILGGTVSLVCLHRGNLRLAMGSFAASAWLILLLVYGVALERVERHQHSAEMLAAVRQVAAGRPRVAGFRFFRPSWVFYAGAPVAQIDGAEDTRHFLESGDDAFVITNDEGLLLLREVLPPDVGPVLRRPQFFKSGDLIVLGRHPQSRHPERLGSRLNAPK